MQIKTDIIPTKPTLVKIRAVHELDLEAICVFAAIGFFLEDDTYWKDQKVLAPASMHQIDDADYLLKSSPYFKWHYTPIAISFDTALDEFAVLFETIIKEQSESKRVILPLSGGLDSRTQAVALKRMGVAVSAYSYAFHGGYPEQIIARQIAKQCGFDFESFTISSGYLWSIIDDLANLNGCYGDFTSPRQMAVIQHLSHKGDVFSLGHWGDVLFDDMKVPDNMLFEDQVEVLLKKLLKRGGLQLAQQLWKAWELDGTFKVYFRNRVSALLKKIDIPHSANAQIRAFKSLYWAPRWTSVNLSVFESIKPIALPYYDRRMCEFICTVPEAYLKDRQLQIEYIKRYAPKLATITWQDQRPFNLTNYHRNRFPHNVPYKLANKLKRQVKDVLGKPYVQRNWELQFLGKENDLHLNKQLFQTSLARWAPDKIIQECYSSFKVNPNEYAHAINMLLVLSKFNQFNTHSKKD